MRATTLAKGEGTVRKFVTAHFSPHQVVKLYSNGRRSFLTQLQEEQPQKYTPPEVVERTLWGILFRSPLGNAAGMFKNGEGYALAVAQGAGFYLAGTTTANIRAGKTEAGVHLPFVPYPRSHAASNALGLPNDGDAAVARRLSGLHHAIPIGASVMGSPDIDGWEKLELLVRGMKGYEQAGVDFIEMNESCPNTGHGKEDMQTLYRRLTVVRDRFLKERYRRVPVIVKFSTDTEVSQVDSILDMLFALGYDGVNFGNTSTAYEECLKLIANKERKLFDYFTQTFKGGVSGRPLKQKSLVLSALAAAYVGRGGPAQEFHVARTGGIEDATDLYASDVFGVGLNMWFTGYFEQFAQEGHGLYRKIYEDYSKRQPLIQIVDENL